jgi:hypothetical protein
VWYLHLRGLIVCLRQNGVRGATRVD